MTLKSKQFFILAILTIFVVSLTSCAIFPQAPTITDVTTSAETVLMGESITIDVTADDQNLAIDGMDDLDYDYEMDDSSMGSISDDGETATFTAANKEGEVTITVTVSDLQDNTEDATYEVTITVVKPTAIYVSTSGLDSSSGSSSSNPLKSIDEAIEKAVDYGVTSIYLTTGTYTPGSGLNSTYSDGIELTNISGITIKGGYSSDFSSVSGYSTLSKEGSTYDDTVSIYNSSSIRLENLVITGGEANVSLWLANDCIITNCIITNANESSGVYIAYSTNVNIYAEIAYNTNEFSGGGGGVYCTSSSNVLISGNIHNNIASYVYGNGGGVYAYNTPNLTISANIYSNTANDEGGGIILYSGCNNSSISGAIYGNVAKCKRDGDGGGISVEANAVTVSGAVYANTSYRYGGGINIDSSASNITVSGNVYNNISSNDGGGINIDGDAVTVSGNVYGNVSYDDAGGIFIDTYAFIATISGNIYNNTASNSAGGIYIYGNNVTLSGNVYSNKGTYGGGVYACYGGTNCVISGYVTNNLATSSSTAGGIEVWGTHTSLTISSNKVTNNSPRNF